MKISKTVSAPVQVLKKTGKELLEPATDKNIHKIAVGAVASPIVGYVYGKIFDFIFSRIPNIPAWLGKVIKIGFPLGLAVGIKRTKIPAGGVIVGSLIGISFLQIAQTIYELITGRGLTIPTLGIKSSRDYAIPAENMEVAGGYAEF